MPLIRMYPSWMHVLAMVGEHGHGILRRLPLRESVSCQFPDGILDSYLLGSNAA